MAERSWRAALMSNIKCAGTNKDTRTPVWKRMTEQRWKRKNYVATPEERRSCRDQYTVVQPNQGGGNTVKTKEHFEHKQLVVEKGKFDRSISRSRCRTVVIVVIMDTVTFRKVFPVGLFPFVAVMATATMIMDLT